MLVWYKLGNIASSRSLRWPSDRQSSGPMRPGIRSRVARRCPRDAKTVTRLGWRCAFTHMPNGTGQKYRNTARRTRGGLPVFTGRINLDRESLDLPRSWRLPRVIFVNSMSDLFHDDVPLFYIKEIFDVMVSCPQHTFQILTKRPERVAELSCELPWPRNVWMGTSVEDARVISRIDELRRVPAQIRFLSCEPLIGPLNRTIFERYPLGNRWR